MYVYDKNRFGQYKDQWIAAADSSIKHLASHPSTRPDLTFMAAYRNQTRVFVSEHRKIPSLYNFELVKEACKQTPWIQAIDQYWLHKIVACFDGGNFLLAGLVLKNQKYIKFGLDLVDGCEDTYASTLTGIGPELFNWVESGTPANDSTNPPPPADQQAFYEKAGFYITNGQYILRPEVLESFYYAYRLTGDQKYRDWSWNGFVAINATARYVFIDSYALCGPADINGDELEPAADLPNFKMSMRRVVAVLAISRIVSCSQKFWNMHTWYTEV